VTSNRVITLLTDFGTADYFVAAVKGVILTINPQAYLVDITHEIPPQDIEAAAFTLLTCYCDFPPGTIHMAVVDPGVGSARRPIVVSAGSYYFVGPDNGVFSYVYDREERGADRESRGAGRESRGDDRESRGGGRESSYQVFHVTADEYFRQPPSPTFHGRDVFAPVAAALSNGIQPEALGPRITDEVRLARLSPVKDETGKLHGRIIHIDRFGNCITNFTPADLADKEPVKLLVNGRVIETFRQFFTDEHGSEDEDCSHPELFAIWGSAGFLELAVNRSSAADLLAAKRGDSVIASL
jgi:S-adenosylmethionine hydrolase